jgi:hypothetical protein
LITRNEHSHLIVFDSKSSSYDKDREERIRVYSDGSKIELTYIDEEGS